jgi:hypothetical protein
MTICDLYNLTEKLILFQGNLTTSRFKLTHALCTSTSILVLIWTPDWGIIDQERVRTRPVSIKTLRGVTITYLEKRQQTNPSPNTINKIHAVDNKVVRV